MRVSLTLYYTKVLGLLAYYPVVDTHHGSSRVESVKLKRKKTDCPEIQSCLRFFFSDLMASICLTYTGGEMLVLAESDNCELPKEESTGGP